MSGPTTDYKKSLRADLLEIARGIAWRLSRVNADRVRRHGGTQLRRGQRWLQRRRTPHPSSSKLPIFIVGSNRSGTQMVCRAIGNSPHGWDYPESDLSIAFNRYLLRSDPIIQRLIRHAPAPMVSFGSILDSQFIDHLLTRFSDARAIWVYRRYQDAALSSVHAWGDHHKQWVRWLVTGDHEHLGPRGERISAQTVELCRQLFREDMSPEGASSLYWYVRNQIYFDLRLYDDPRVLIVNYEAAVLAPERAFRRILAFLGFPYHPEVIRDVFSGSAYKPRWPGIEPRTEHLCDAHKARLDQHYLDTGGHLA
jgi:hypothetical protein